MNWKKRRVSDPGWRRVPVLGLTWNLLGTSHGEPGPPAYRRPCNTVIKVYTGLGLPGPAPPGTMRLVTAQPEASAIHRNLKGLGTGTSVSLAVQTAVAARPAILKSFRSGSWPGPGDGPARCCRRSTSAASVLVSAPGLAGRARLQTWSLYPVPER